jgi:outer membrane protein OmpA-like peptidoglycan-associated protein
MKKNISLIVAFFIFCLNTNAQNTTKEYQKYISTGDKFYAAEDFFSASQEYLKASKLNENDGYPDMKIAECYRLNSDYNDAEKWYEKCVLYYKAKDATLVFWLGMMQKTNGKYSDAEITLNKFISTYKPKDAEEKAILKIAEVEMKGCRYAQQQLEQPTKEININLLPFPVNTKNSEFAPVIFYHDSSIVITSARADSKGEQLNLTTGEARTDNFRYEKRGERWLRTDNEDNFDVVNTANDDGAGQLNKKTNKYYYTICDPECGIYLSRKNDGKFTKPEKLNININDGYWNAQPTITASADTMFFVSKRDGGQGANDIWMSINADKSGAREDWGVARNMYSINTSGAEIAPFWDSETNTLYFASNGLIGFGGLDIYKTNIYKIGAPENLGLPYNSNLDDFYFTLGKLKGYIVSNRYGGFGLGDIYSFDRYVKETMVGYVPTKENPIDAESISSVGKIYYADTQESVPNTSIYLKDESGIVLKEAITNTNGEFRFDNLAPDKNFKIIINSNDPRIRAKVEYFVNRQGKLEGKIYLTKTNSINNKKEEKPAEEAKIEEKPAVTPSPELDKAEKKEDERTVNNETQVTIEKKPLAMGSNKKQVSKSAIPKKLGKVLFENVYYGFNESELSNSAKIVLDNLAQYLQENKSAQVEIRAFTDGLGNTSYNLSLAKERGKACFDYLISKGVEQTSLLIIPAGSTNAVGNNNSYIGRQLNRRVQFTINGASTKYQQSTSVYIVEPKMTIFSLAKKYNISVNSLIEMNGINENEFKAYSAIRVPEMSKNGISTATLDALKNNKTEYKFENMQFVPLK